MIFSRTTTAVHFLKEDDPVAYAVCRPDQAGADVVNFIRRDFLYLRPEFRKNVFYTDASVLESFHGNAWMQRIGMPAVEGRISGTWVALRAPGEVQTVFYDLRYKYAHVTGFQFNGTILQMLSLPAVQKPLMDFLVHVGDRKIITGSSLKYMPLSLGQMAYMLVLLSHYAHHCVRVPLENAAQQEKGKSRLRNETHLPIMILGATSNTTNSRTKDCVVGGARGGFYRKQLCGKGRTEIRKVWVRAHQRKGHDRLPG
jgi:hypothetical protein